MKVAVTGRCLVLGLTLMLLLLGGGVAQADWFGGDAKWVQLPDQTLLGIDIQMDEFGGLPRMLADDFQCTNNSVLTDFHLWFSWAEDVPGDILMLQISIYSDDPIGPGYSQPSELLWTTNMPGWAIQTNLWSSLFGGEQEWFWDPIIDNPEPPPPIGPGRGDTNVWQMNIYINPDDAFVQTGSVTRPVVYWLAVRALTQGGELGWKTRDWIADGQWNDAAVFSPDLGTSWANLLYPQQHPFAGERIDLSFVITDMPVLPPEFYDYGDAPDPGYPTLLASDGARHMLDPRVHLGTNIDVETEGLQSPFADGDDLDNVADEDGVFMFGLTRGVYTLIDVVASTDGVLQAWFDFNTNGSWADGGEQVFTNELMTPGTNQLAVYAPFNSATGFVCARFRFSTVSNLTDTGLAPDGEVEDHVVWVYEEDLDYGDAPDPSYPTLKVNNGARHVMGGLYVLGSSIDSELNGKPDARALGDDKDGGDDEDGVFFPASVRQGEDATVDVVCTSDGGILQAWIDFDMDGDWASGGENIFVNEMLVMGTNTLPFSVPLWATLGTNYARFRVSDITDLSYTGWASNGEVEDHTVVVEEALPDVGCTKWLQRPDTWVGMDLVSWTDTLGLGSIARVADDWWCDGRPITAIRWWGSYAGWDEYFPPPPPPENQPVSFTLRWYTDVPAGYEGIPFSRPGHELTNITVTLADYGVRPVPPGWVSWEYYGPNFLFFSDQFEHEYEYLVELPEPWNEKEGTIYWLSIEANYEIVVEPPPFPWGWTTTDPVNNWHDDAVISEYGSAWLDLYYPPMMDPWLDPPITDHPYEGRSINMAFELLSDVCPRRCKKWQQPPDMVEGTDMASWRWISSAPDMPIRADDFISDGRLITDIHWWGSYMKWQNTVQGSPTNPVPPPTGNDHPVGFNISWHAHNDQTGLPGQTLSEFFVSIWDCHEVYYDTVQQWWQPEPYEHEYQYYLDLLDPDVHGDGWPETATSQYWVNVQAVFPDSFTPGEGQHDGWGWKITPELQLVPSAVSNSLAGWRHDKLLYPHPRSNQVFDLAFELTTTEVPETNSPWATDVAITDINVHRPSDSVTLTSTGDCGCGVQVLQQATNLQAGGWDVMWTNDVPRPENVWWIMPVETQRFYRIIQAD